MIAASPNWRSRSSSKARFPQCLASDAETFVDRTVLPVPPFGENTVMSRPCRPPADAACLRPAWQAFFIADVMLLPQLTDNVVFAIKKACHAGRKQAASAGGRQGRLVTVFSPKGGTGKTVLSTNVSASLAKHWGKRALLLDLDLQFGDAAIMLGLEPDKTIYDLVTAAGELGCEKKPNHTQRHD